MPKIDDCNVTMSSHYVIIGLLLGSETKETVGIKYVSELLTKKEFANNVMTTSSGFHSQISSQDLRITALSNLQHLTFLS